MFLSVKRCSDVIENDCRLPSSYHCLAGSANRLQQGLVLIADRDSLCECDIVRLPTADIACMNHEGRNLHRFSAPLPVDEPGIAMCDGALSFLRDSAAQSLERLLYADLPTEYTPRAYAPVEREDEDILDVRVLNTTHILEEGVDPARELRRFVRKKLLESDKTGREQPTFLSLRLLGA